MLNQNRPAEAEPLFKRALEIAENNPKMASDIHYYKEDLDKLEDFNKGRK